MEESSIFCELLLVKVWIQPHDDIPPNVTQCGDYLFILGTQPCLLYHGLLIMHS